MTEPTPKYHIGDTVWRLVGGYRVPWKVQTELIYGIYTSPTCIAYTIRDSDADSWDTEDELLGATWYSEDIFYSTKEAAEKRCAELQVQYAAQDRANKIALKKNELKHLKFRQSEQLALKIKQLEKELTELEGHQ